MTFWDYLKSTEGRDLKGITEDLAERLSKLIGRGHSVADLLAHYSDDFGHIPAKRLQDMARARRSWQLWRKRKQQLNEARDKAKLPPLPTTIGAHAATAHALDAVTRTARLCPRKRVADDEAWLAVLRGGAELWEACVGLARKEATLHCDAREQGSAGAARHDDYVMQREALTDIAPHRWLAIRRGVKEGALELRFELPVEAMLEQVALRKETLGPDASDREDRSLLEELVLDDLPAWLTTILDHEAELSAIDAACESLVGLLRAAPLQARRLAAIFVGRAKTPVGMVIADREGEIVAQRALKAEGPLMSKLLELINEYNVHHVVLPTNAPASDTLTTIQNELSDKDLQLTPIRPAAIAEARRPLTDPPMRLGASVASALVLARRALDPIKEWALVDPVGIGVAEYQNDLNEDRLRAALKETVELTRLERRRGGKSGGPSPAATRGVASAARLNPLVKTINDLRPGMTLHGVVTNISHFGAFINVGLAQEALVHISELSDRFVSNPNEVVSIGQQISAHVLAVDPPRGRISLSMKSQRRVPGQAAGGRREERANGGAIPLAAMGGNGGPRPGGPRPGGPRPGGPGPAGPGAPASPTHDDAPRRAAAGGGAPPRNPKSRSEALANLERLFKK
jgi:predicted RNA-binding protein with RPS1 domain